MSRLDWLDWLWIAIYFGVLLFQDMNALGYWLSGVLGGFMVRFRLNT